MTQWFCDRCGQQVGRNSNGTETYQIIKKCYDADNYGHTKLYERNIKLCEQCALEMQKFLDDEFAKLPDILTGRPNRNT